MISECGDRRPKVILMLILIVGKTAREGDLMAKKIPRRKYAFLADGRRNLGFPGMVHDKSQEDDRRADQ